MPERVRDFYDQLAASFHLIFEDWDASITRQAATLGPLIERECGSGRKLQILDCACGIGTQALGFASRGHDVTACDISSRAVERARAEAARRETALRLQVADMRDLSRLPAKAFDAVICFDNALPHFDTDDELTQAVRQIRYRLRPGGIFAASIRDYDRLVEDRPVVQGPAFLSDGGRRRIVHQVWDWLDGRRYTFHIYITRETANGWDAQHYASSYRAVLRAELSAIVAGAEFTDVCWRLPEESGFYQPVLLARTPA